MTKKYEYLEKYITKNWQIEDSRKNGFDQETELDIKRAEKRINRKFPESLKKFWLEIGSGYLTESKNGLVRDDWANEILEPKAVADLMLDEGEIGMRPGTRESFEDIPNAIPFMHLDEGMFYLYMLPGSDAVYDLHGEGDGKIEEHFEDLIWKMYHIDPVYFLNLPPEDK